MKRGCRDTDDQQFGGCVCEDEVHICNADWSDARSECCLKRIGPVTAPIHRTGDRDSATLLVRKHAKCARAQVNTSSVAFGLLDGDTFPEPYATLPGVQAQPLCCYGPGRQRRALMAVAAVMVVAIAAAIIAIAVAVAVAVMLARVGSDANPRRSVRSYGVRLGKRWCSGQRTKSVSALRTLLAHGNIAARDTKTEIRSAQLASWIKRRARRELHVLDNVGQSIVCRPTCVRQGNAVLFGICICGRLVGCSRLGWCLRLTHVQRTHAWLPRLIILSTSLASAMLEKLFSAWLFTVLIESIE
ncbi:hypothetical protein KCU89_g129, partial [Aureobasidium melanogenum]